MESGELVELEITGVAHGGVFVARHGADGDNSGRVVFVSDTLPGERVRAEITEVKKSFARAVTVEVLESAPERVPHVWRQADVAVAPAERPGGADFGHIALSAQRELKARVLREAFERFAGLAIDPVVVGPESVLGADHPDAAATIDGTGYRTRLSLHVDDEGRIGPYAARSHRVIEVAEHPLAVPRVAEVALALRKAKPGRVDLVLPGDGVVRTIRRPETKDRRAPRPEPEIVAELVGEREFHVDAGGFWQVHRAAAATLDRAVRDALGELSSDAWHLDLYGGVGLFGAALGDLAGPARLTTVEADARASLHAEDNLIDLGVEAVNMRVDRFLSRVRAQASLLDREMLTRGVTLLDPPRSGAGREVVESIADLGSSRIAYVACDPVALARDVGWFRELGYELASLDAFDLFPHSHHVEALAILTR